MSRFRLFKLQNDFRNVSDICYGLLRLKYGVGYYQLKKAF